jgi:hypothetical protein
VNSTPVGEVLTPSALHRHRARAGLRIGDGQHVDLVRYAGWLARSRHAPAADPATPARPAPATGEAARGAAALGSRREQVRGHGQKLTAKQESVIAALLTEPTYAAAAAKAGIAESTLYRWMNHPEFRRAYRAARRELVEAAVGRIQSAAGEAVDALLAVARTGRRDGDRVRAAVALLGHATQGLADADTLHGGPDPTEAAPANPGDVVALLAERLREIDQSDLSTAEKARLTASLADAYLRAVGVNVLDKRLEAWDAVVLARKERPS